MGWEWLQEGGRGSVHLTPPLYPALVCSLAQCRRPETAESWL